METLPAGKSQKSNLKSQIIFKIEKSNPNRYVCFEMADLYEPIIDETEFLPFFEIVFARLLLMVRVGCPTLFVRMVVAVLNDAKGS